MLRCREAGFRPAAAAAVAAGGAVPKSALSAVATYAPPRRAHHRRPAGGMPTPECRGRPPAAHLKGGESSGPGPAPGVLFAIAAPKDGPVSRTLLAQATRGRAAGRAVGGRLLSRNLLSTKCAHARCHRKKTDLQAVLCSDGTLVSAYGLMLLLVAGRRRSYAPAPVSAHKRANRKATSNLRGRASQNDPHARSQGSLAHPARKIGRIRQQICHQ